MAIWTRPISVELLTTHSRNTAMEHLGIELVEVGDDFLRGRVPVDSRTHQPYGLLHGGVSVVLAETLGSLGANYSCAPGYHAVGLDINANHLRAGKPPLLTGIARPVHVGNTTSVWEIRITDVDDKLVCVSRLTCAVLQER